MATNKRGAGKGAAVPALVQWPRIDIALSKLHLDLHNPRHEPVATEDEAIALLYQTEGVEVLARDIVDERAMSPLDAIGVVAMPGNPGHYFAVEGNRRLCSLLLLNDYNRAPTGTAKTLFRGLASKIKIPKTIEVVEFSTREDSKHWRDLRHLGPQDGKGLVSWNPTQKDRAAGGGANALAVAILDRARDGGWLSNDQQPAVTTLTRYLQNREVRSALGLGHRSRLEYTHDQEEVDAALRQFLVDAFPAGSGVKAKVHSRSDDKERAAYAREFRKLGNSPQTEIAQQFTPGAAIPQRMAKPGTRNRQDPAARKYLVPSVFICRSSDRNLQLIFKEMQRTLIDEHEFACAYLLRAFIERIMILYLKKVDKGYTAPNDEALVKRCSLKLDPSQKLPKFKPLRTAASGRDSSHSLHTLGAAVHAGMITDRRALISYWQNWEYALVQMLEEISKP